jgi:hypothetical protein
MNVKRKNELTSAIKAQHKDITVKEGWEMCDNYFRGLDLSARNATAGCVLAASKTDAELDAMTDAEVLVWAANRYTDYAARCGTAHKAHAVDRMVDEG